MTRKIIQASFFWKNDKPGGLGFSRESNFQIPHAWCMDFGY